MMVADGESLGKALAAPIVTVIPVTSYVRTMAVPVRDKSNTTSYGLHLADPRLGKPIHVQSRSVAVISRRLRPRRVAPVLAAARPFGNVIGTIGSRPWSEPPALLVTSFNVWI